MAVVVQELVDAEASGVLFTDDPISGNRTVAVVEATPGLGEALVSGAITPDSFRVRAGEVIDRTEASTVATLTDDQVVRSAYSLESGQAAATRLLRAGVTGIVCASDPLALGAIRAARRAGLRVPEDVSVVGYDDSAFMNCTEPPLTTVRQPIESMGRAAVTMLVSQIDRTSFTAEELLYEPELVVRGSTAPVRVTTA